MRRVVGALLAAFAVLLVPVPAAAATDRPVVRVIQIGGLLDRVQADFWQNAIERANAAGDEALIVQLDSSRSVIDPDKLLRAIRDATTPVAVWVGPARAGGAGRDLVPFLEAADVVGVAPGADVPRGTAVDVRSPTLGDFLVDLDGRAGMEIPTRVVRAEGEIRRQEPLVTVRFAKPGLVARTIHGVTSPGPAYALLVFGLLLAVLEFATAGVGLAAATAALFLVLAALGLGGLPVNGFGVAFILFAMFGFAVDAQAGAPRVWSRIGALALFLGSFRLYRDGMTVPLPWIVGVLGLTAAFVLTGLPSLIRARFSSPTVGREGFIGETGNAVGAIAPEGVVRVRGGTWRARTNRATPIVDGGAIRVVGIDGLVLDVEPEDGGAKDYRERSKPST